MDKLQRALNCEFDPICWEKEDGLNYAFFWILY
jgi:hypothetical protein